MTKERELSNIYTSLIIEIDEWYNMVAQQKKIDF